MVASLVSLKTNREIISPQAETLAERAVHAMRVYLRLNEAACLRFMGLRRMKDGEGALPPFTLGAVHANGAVSPDGKLRSIRLLR